MFCLSSPCPYVSAITHRASRASWIALGAVALWAPPAVAQTAAPKPAPAPAAPAPAAPAPTAPAPATPAPTTPAPAPAGETTPTTAPTAEPPPAGGASEATPTAEAQPQGSAQPAEASEPAAPDSADSVPPETTGSPEPAAKTTDDDKSWAELHPDDEVEQVKRVPRYSAFVLAEGTAKYGVYSVAQTGTFEDEDVETENLRTGQLGGQATVGVMPGGSAFAMAGRLRAGSYVGQRVPDAYVAAEMLFGANFARNEQGDSFTYVMGGIGVEFLPAENEDMLTLSATGGTVIGGISFGGGINIAANDQIAMALIGMQIGWGRLF